MKKKICGAIIAISLFLIIGLVGGVDCGEHISNLLWCIPCACAMWVAAIIGEFGF